MAQQQQQQGGLAGLDEDKMRLVQDLEIEMMTDMYAKLSSACHKKCIPPKYRESELQKGESVCIDRCVAKYLDVHERIGKKLTELSLKDQDFQARVAGSVPS
jgi:import inner membrane translocase subunit TIM10